MIMVLVRWLLSKETQVTNVRGDMEKKGTSNTGAATVKTDFSKV